MIFKIIGYSIAITYFLVALFEFVQFFSNSVWQTVDRANEIHAHIMGATIVFIIVYFLSRNKLDNNK